MLKRLYDIGLSDEKTCRGCNREEGTEKHRLYHCPCWKEARNQIGELETGTMGKNLEERSEVAKRNHVVPSEGMSMEEKPSDSAKVGIREAQKLGHHNRRVSGIMSPPKALCSECQARGACVDGQWCR